MFKELIGIEEAVKTILSSVKPIEETEVMDVEAALGRVLAEDVFSEIDVPGFDRATMDGYAVRSEDVAGAWEDRPKRLKLVGLIRTGRFPNVVVGPGETVRIDTGGALPKGADAVVPIEYVYHNGYFIDVLRAVPRWANIQWTGSDVAKGEPVFFKGTLLSPRHIAALVACGIKKVRVYRKVKVAVFSIGDELVEGPDELSFGKVIDVNRRSLKALVREYGGEPIDLGIARDNPEEIAEKLNKGLEADIIISSGGSSVGYSDMIRKVVEEIGGRVVFHGVRSKPGKPVLFALVKGKAYLGLPGHPTSAIVSFMLYALPALLRVSGALGRFEISGGAYTLGARVYAVKGRTLVQTVSLRRSFADPIPSVSGAVTTLSLADGFFTVDEMEEYVEEGEKVIVEPLWKLVQLPDIVVVGEFSPKVLTALRKEFDGLLIRFIRRSSQRALESVKKGMADIAIVKSKDGSFKRKIVLVGEEGNVASAYSNVEAEQRVCTHQSAIYRYLAGMASGAIVPDEIASLYGLKPSKVIGEEALEIICSSELQCALCDRKTPLFSGSS